MKGKFSHCFYDDLTEILFMYFHNVTVLPLSGDDLEKEYEEIGIYLDPKEYAKMASYFLQNPTKDTCV